MECKRRTRQMKAALIDIFGWLGSAAVVIAYAMVSGRKLAGSSHLYQGLNLFGGVCLVINTFYYHAYPSTFVNVVWVAIAVFALVRA